MSAALHGVVTRMLGRPVHGTVRSFATRLGREAGALGVLFYGSNLRTGSLDGVLDFYLLLPGPQRERIWPRISYREHMAGDAVLRAKVATMSLGQFGRAAAGNSRDTTIWARFVQPSALVWAADGQARDAIAQAIGDAAQTAAGLAAVLGPVEGRWDEYWRALFRATYRSEFRVEQPGREEAILAVDAEHFRSLLPLAWQAAGLDFAQRGGDRYRPRLSDQDRASWRRWWDERRRLGKPLNVARLVKAAGTFDGAADYAAWKVGRHSGIVLEVTPFRRNHPLLAVPGAALELWRKRRAQRM